MWRTSCGKSTILELIASQKEKKNLKSNQNVSKNRTKIKDFGAMGVPKSTKMVPRSAPKATLGASRLEVAKKGAAASYKFEIIGATWEILGAILVPAGRQGGPKILH